MQPEHSTWQQPKGSSWSQSHKGQAQQQSPAGQRVPVKLSGCSDAVPPALVTMQAFKVWWKNPKKWERELPLFMPGLVMLSLFYFFSSPEWFPGAVFVLSLQIPSKWVTEHTENPWTADVRQIILPWPRAQLLLQEIIKHWLLLFSLNALRKEIKRTRLRTKSRAALLPWYRYKWTGGNSSISGDWDFCMFWEQ